MQPHDLLRTGLQRLEYSLFHEQATDPAEAAAYPYGFFRFNFSAGEDGPIAYLRFAASDRGIARVEMVITLPEAPQAGSAVSLYEEIGLLHARCYPCFLSRAPDSNRLRVRSQVLTTRAVGADDALDWPDIAATPEAMEHWLHMSFSAAGRLLEAFLGLPHG